MPNANSVKRTIYQIEGFEIDFVDQDGDIVHGNTGLDDDYPRVNSAKNNWTLNEWKNERFYRYFNDLGVVVYDGHGNEVQYGQTTLQKIRSTY
jgi:hypothetical protein